VEFAVKVPVEVVVGAVSTSPAKKRRVSNFMDSDSDSEHGAVEPLDELAEYMKLPALGSKSEVTLLEWWKQHALQFPLLSKMARQYHCCPASSAGVERLFSRAGSMHDAKKKGTKEVTLKQALFAALA
jgi:hypothetical protein